MSPVAIITKRFNRDGELIGWQAKIRRQGYPQQSKTCDRKADAEAWARGAFVDRRPAEQMTLGDAIAHYLDAVAPTHKGGDIEAVRLGRFKREEPALCAYAEALAKRNEIEIPPPVRRSHNRLLGWCHRNRRGWSWEDQRAEERRLQRIAKLRAELEELT